MTFNSFGVAAAGLTLVGAGVSVSTDAGTRRAAGAPTGSWLVRGTVGLVLLGSGISLVADAARRSAVSHIMRRRPWADR